MPLLRRSEWLLIVYFLYTAALSLVLHLRPPIPAITIGLNLVVIAGFLVLARAHSLRDRHFLGIFRDWYPIPLMLLAYREMGWFADPRHTVWLERSWEAWDKVLLNHWGLRAAIEFLGPLLPSLLELSYALVYTIPSFALAMLYVYRRRERVPDFLLQFLLGILIAYALFPCFPSEPPRTAFPLQDLPSFLTPFRRLNLWLLSGYGIHTSVFPSAHVSGAFSGAFAMLRLMREHRWVGWFLLGLAASIALATVYGRYHYAADAVAGFAVSLLALALSRRIQGEAALVHLYRRRQVSADGGGGG
jgi:membrane-associated phospholipid phosphatase